MYHIIPFEAVFIKPLHLIRVWDYPNKQNGHGLTGAGFGRFLGVWPHSLRLRFIRKTHCQKNFMLWRGSARLGGIGGVDFNILGNLAELICKLEMNADIAVFVNLDVVYQVN